MPRTFMVELSVMCECNSKDKNKNTAQRSMAKNIACYTLEELGYKVNGYSNYRLLNQEEAVIQQRIAKSLVSLTLGIPADAIVKVKETLTALHFTFLY